MGVESLHENNEISKSTRDYLLSDGLRTPILYFLPKIHKSLEKPPGRPIESSNSSPSEKISQMSDIIMNEYVALLPSTIKDTTDFLQKCALISNIPEGAFIVSWDVVGLYPNIPIEEGLKASEWMLKKHRKGNVNPSNKSVIELLRLVLTCNNFEFNGEHYKQIKGTAMGTKVAPTFANIFMGKFENDHIYTHSLYAKVLVWLRFIDDIFFIFTGTLTELKQFHNDLNHTRYNSIQFTMDYSTEKIHFLDTTIKIENGTLVSTLYTKPTDSHSYLLYESCHPKHIIIGKHSLFSILKNKKNLHTLDRFPIQCNGFGKLSHCQALPNS